MIMKKTHGSLFSGIGAPELASEWMGWKNLFHCEINDFCRSFLEKRFKSASYADITTTDFNIWRNRVDILTGGFPCQDASKAKQMGGKGQLGLEGERTGLWWHMCRAVDEIRPRWVVAENVANITRTNNGRDFAKILHSLSGLGYNAEWKIMYASDAGAPQRRARCYLVAYSDSVRLPEGEYFFSNVCPSIKQKLRSNCGAALSIGKSWPAEPPVCSVDYGFSSKSLEVNGKSRLIKEVFHAYGNSMCPQIVHGIFKRIEELGN